MWDNNLFVVWNAGFISLPTWCVCAVLIFTLFSSMDVHWTNSLCGSISSSWWNQRLVIHCWMAGSCSLTNMLHLLHTRCLVQTQTSRQHSAQNAADLCSTDTVWRWYEWHHRWRRRRPLTDCNINVQTQPHSVIHWPALTMISTANLCNMKLLKPFSLINSQSWKLKFVHKPFSLINSQSCEVKI